MGGFVKPGFPGILVAEGLGRDLDAYVHSIKSLGWQAMQVRADESSSETDLRFGGVFRELPEDSSGLTFLGQACRDAGLEALFLAALKIKKDS